MAPSTPAPDGERIATLEAEMDGVKDDVKSILEGQQRMDQKITALSDQLTGTRGKIQGAVAVLGLLGTGGVLHWAAGALSVFFSTHGGTH